MPDGHACIIRALRTVTERGAALGVDARQPAVADRIISDGYEPLFLGTDVLVSEVEQAGVTVAHAALTDLIAVMRDEDGQDDDDVSGDLLSFLAGFWRHGVAVGAVAVANREQAR